MKILQINTTVNSGSTGRIAEDIGKILIASGHESLIGYGRGNQKSASQTIQIGDKWGIRMHGLQTLLFDRRGLASQAGTRKFLNEIEQWRPDIIHLHNIHGYYINMKLLGEFLATYGCPVVWTFHDSWAYTGHCTYFDNINCERWKTGCYQCPKKGKYPSSLFWDRSRQNYLDKKALFADLPHLHIVTPSYWLSNLVGQSFLKHHPRTVIHNGVDLDTFSKRTGSESFLAKYNITGKKVLLGVASIWDPRKGLDDFIRLSKKLDEDFKIVLIGLSQKQMERLPENILGISRTENIHELAQWYSAASVFLNPTWQDNFPTTNIEALACGTPVVTYRTGGSPEAVNEATGTVTEKGDIEGMIVAIRKWCNKNREDVAFQCRKRAEIYFNKDERFQDYLELYKSLLTKEQNVTHF